MRGLVDELNQIGATRPGRRHERPAADAREAGDGNALALEHAEDTGMSCRMPSAARQRQNQRPHPEQL